MKDIRCIFIDTETTGLSPFSKGHRVIELSCIEYIGNVRTGKVFSHLLNPEGKKSTLKAFQVHNIPDESLKTKPTFKDISDEFIRFIKGAHIVAFNAVFDTTFLNSELNRAGYASSVAGIGKDVSCAMEMAKTKFGLSRISLDAACKRYEIDLSRRTHHGATIDAELAAELYFKLIDDKVAPLKKTPQSKSHKVTKAISIPRAYKHPVTGNYVQLNFCKNPECNNFGIPAKNPKKKPDGTLNRGLGNEYKLSPIKGVNAYTLICKLCGHSTQIINNRAFTNEQIRIEDIGKQKEPCCPNTGNPHDTYGVRYQNVTITDESGTRIERVKKPACENSGKGIFSNPGRYKLDGKTRKSSTWVYVDKKPGKRGKPANELRFEEKSPSQRVLCKRCNTRFSIKMDSQQRHYLREHNEPIFLNLVNKGIVNRVIEQFQINPKTLYDKINFFYEQCLAFDLFHNGGLQEALKGKELNLSTDRQHYLSNWGDTNIPMPTRIVNTSTADNASGYVFAATVNFDFTSDAEHIKREHKEKKEFEKASYYRRYAQYILDNEELQESSELNQEDIPLQTPAKGLLVHQTYSMLAHFNQLKNTLAPCEHVNLFADNDAGFKLSIGAIFNDWVESSKLSAFQVITERSGGNKLLDKQSGEQLKKRFELLKEENPESSQNRIMRLLWQEQVNSRVTMPGTRSEWIVSPNPRSRFDALLPLTPISDEYLESLINKIEMASLNGVDNWFQILRRHINMLERPVTSGTNSKRWNAYAGYNPEWMVKLLEIKRVYFNYCMTNKKSITANSSEDKAITTPAMRLSLVDKTYFANDILSFNLFHNLLYSR